MVSKNNETFVYQAVASGDLVIKDDGTIWRVQSRKYSPKTATIYHRPCTPKRAEKLHREGYLTVAAMIEGKRVYALAHRLVYFHFKGTIPNGLTVNHNNGNKQDNHPNNLLLATPSEQQIHAITVLGQVRLRGEQKSQSKVTCGQVAEIRLRRSQGEKLLSIAKDFGVSFQLVSAIAHGHRWTHLG